MIVANHFYGKTISHKTNSSCHVDDCYIITLVIVSLYSNVFCLTYMPGEECHSPEAVRHDAVSKKAQITEDK